MALPGFRPLTAMGLVLVGLGLSLSGLGVVLFCVSLLTEGGAIGIAGGGAFVYGFALAALGAAILAVNFAVDGLLDRRRTRLGIPSRQPSTYSWKVATALAGLGIVLLGGLVVVTYALDRVGSSGPCQELQAQELESTLGSLPLWAEARTRFVESDRHHASCDPDDGFVSSGQRYRSEHSSRDVRREASRFLTQQGWQLMADIPPPPASALMLHTPGMCFERQVAGQQAVLTVTVTEDSSTPVGEFDIEVVAYPGEQSNRPCVQSW